MRVLVTGAAGLIGRAVVAELRLRGHVVIGVDGRRCENADVNILSDLTGHIAAQYVFDHNETDAVIHLAGKRMSVANQHSHAADLLLDNLAIDTNVLRAMRQHKVKRGVYASTVSVYASERGSGPLLEAGFRNGFPEEAADRFPDDSVRFSAFGKLTAERAIEAMNLQDGSAISVVRLANTYGPGDDFGPNALVIPSLIRRVFAGESPLTIRVPPEIERDVLYVEDAARGIVAALEQELPGTWNLGTGVGTKLHEIALAVVTASGLHGGPTPDIDFNLVGAQATAGAFRKVLDSSKAKRDLGWEASTPLAEGIRRTVEWYRERHP